MPGPMIPTMWWWSEATRVHANGQTLLGRWTNATGSDVTRGDVVILGDSPGSAIEFDGTTTARYEGIVGVVMGTARGWGGGQPETFTIPAGERGFIAIAGYVPVINVASAASDGDFLETSTTAKQAAPNATRRSGSFGTVLDAGSTPPAWLWGWTDSSIATGEPGAPGADGVGVPAGGSTGQVLTKASGTDYDTEWISGPGAGSFSSYDSLIAGMSGLIHRWEFEEASGNFADSVGSLTLTASGTWTYDVAGGPVSGAAGSVTAGASARGLSSGLGSIPVGGAARTIVCVYKGKQSASLQALFNYGAQSGRQLFGAYINGAATVDDFGVAAWSDDLDLTGSTCNLETWHMVAASYDGTQGLGSFIDGRIGGHRLGAALNTATGGNFSVGQDVAGSNQIGAITIDDLAVFDRTLQPYELQQLYNALVGALP